MKQARFPRKFVVATVALLAAGFVSAQTPPFFFGGNHSSTYWGGNNYFADQKELGSNLTMVSCDHYGFQPTLVRAALDSAGACGLNAILTGRAEVEIPSSTTARPMTRGDLTSK